MLCSCYAIVILNNRVSSQYLAFENLKYRNPINYCNKNCVVKKYMTGEN